MLQAKNQDGQLIVLAHLSEQEKEEMRRQIFYCPACTKRVQLKKGKVKTWYFAHVHEGNPKDAGKEWSNAESDRHLEGKEALYLWIQRETPLVQLEFTRKTAAQRPDIYCVYKEKSFAVEYQCAAIDADVLRRRTERHIESCDVPIWIVGTSDSKFSAKPMHLKSLMYLQDLFSLLPVLYIFEGSFTHLKICLPLAAFSPRKILYASALFSKRLPFFRVLQMLPTNFPTEKMKKDWLAEKKKYRLSVQSKPTALLKYLFQFFPSYQLTFPLLPATVGVPVLYACHLYSHCMEWQLWFQICILFPMARGERVRLSVIQEKWCEMIQKGYILVRPLPLVYRTNHFDALWAYMIFLERLGMLYIKNGWVEKGRSEPQKGHIEDIFQSDQNILNVAFIHLKSQLKLMVEKNEKG